MVNFDSDDIDEISIDLKKNKIKTTIFTCSACSEYCELKTTSKNEPTGCTILHAAKWRKND